MLLGHRAGGETMDKKSLNRRDFLKYNLLATCWAATGIGLFRPRPLSAGAGPDISVVKGAPAMAARAAVKLLGGMGQFVKPGNRVIIKPNMSWTGGVEWGVNTHPAVVRELVIMCREADAAQTLVVDHTINDAKICLKNSGIKAACDSVEQGIVAAVNNQYQYRDQQIPAVNKGDGVEIARVNKGDVNKGDGVEIARFFICLFVVMKLHATSSQNRCAGCLASYHMPGYRATKHF
jgi:hypothetical protein